MDGCKIFKFQELNRTNRQMQQRIVELLEGVPNEEVTSKYYVDMIFTFFIAYVGWDLSS